ncbi:Linamarin synthase 2 [Camellia lanceoleosa]|uniref:Linamarin synthase 2 n=1 Tax=Camellia lanceoleosa TaxID=1840588 RepID=A0ACC0J321_9ERIC|nr:Linamarin synthase 2 [Camellia lanceoleosa]
MGSELETRKPHVVCVPYPAQGHVTPLMLLAKLLYSRGFHVTFVNTEFNHRRLVRSKGPDSDSVKGLPGFQFETIPDGLPPSDRDATQDVVALCDSVRKNCLVPFIDLLHRLNSTSEVPRVSCIVSDGVMSFAIEAAREMGIPEVQFWTASACSFMGYLHYRELIRRGIFPFKDENFMSDGTLDTPIDWIPGMRNIRLKDLPSFLRTTNPNAIMFDFMGEEAQNCLKAPAIIFNTFDAFEQEVLEAIVSKFPRIYNIGPLPLLCKHANDSQVNSIDSSLWKEDSRCLEWLDQREHDSVVYVNYGNQQPNCRYACIHWGIGMEIDHDVKRGEVEALVREMMEGAEGKEMRRRAKEWKKKAEEATVVGGSSFNGFDRFIKEALLA